MGELRVLVIGGYGFFGRRLVELIARKPDLHVIVAGRTLAGAESLVERLRHTSLARLSPASFDTTSAIAPQDLRRLAPHTVVLTAGPFQGQNYHVARACIDAGLNYIDLADGRAFVNGIHELDARAKARGVRVISGASSVPALSTSAVDSLVQDMTTVDSIDIGISPGNRTERGLATVEAILSYCGKPLPDQGVERRFGWSGSRSHRYPAPVGRRWLSPCDVPDLTLLPARYAGSPLVRFGAGLELPFLHWGMNAMAWATRCGVVRDWSAHAAGLKRIADVFKRLGSDAGAMHVTVTGRYANGSTASRSWHLVATHGDGPYVPTLAAAALIDKLLDAAPLAPGATPCVGLLTLEDFEQQARGLHIHMAEDAT